MKEFLEFYETAARAVLPYFMALGVLGCFVIMYESMHFCYRYFIHSGNVLVWGVHDDNDLDRLWKDKFDKKGLPVGWGIAIILCLLLLAVSWLSAWIWPVTFLFTLPLLVMIAIGYRTRKKTAFLQKLKGGE